LPGTNTNLLHKSVNYGRKKFYNIWPRLEKLIRDALALFSDDKKKVL